MLHLRSSWLFIIVVDVVDVDAVVDVVIDDDAVVVDDDIVVFL